MKIIGEFSLDEVLPYVGKPGTPKKKYTVNDITYKVKMSSVRLRLFKKSQVCVVCGLLGTRFILEQYENDGSPHFDLYGEDIPSKIFVNKPMVGIKNNLVSFTKDHIVPRSKGGEDKITNMQIMCMTCNGIKGDTNLPIKLVRYLRKIYNDNLSLSNQEFMVFMNIERNKLKRLVKKMKKRRLRKGN